MKIIDGPFSKYPRILINRWPSAGISAHLCPWCFVSLRASWRDGRLSLQAYNSFGKRRRW